MRAQLAPAHALVGAIGAHVLGSGGKRLRPALLLWTAELCGYDGPRRVQAAAAIELLHSATLLHDDVVDLADTRRGQPAARAIWGNRRAVLAGDFLYARASSMIVEDGDIAILEIFTDTIRRMAEGELMQLEQSFNPDISEARYYEVIERKSASLMAAATGVGAQLGGVTRAEQRRLREFGRAFGMAFQLRDDALDYAASAHELGKAPFADLREGKVTLPLLLALKRASASERAALESVLKAAAGRALQNANASAAPDAGDGVGDGGAVTPDASADANANAGASVAPLAVLTEAELACVRELVQKHRGVADTDRRARTHVAHAAEAIAPFPDGLVKDALLAAASYAVDRTS